MKGEHKHLFEALTDAQIMGLCIWAEARGEGMEGRIAVGSVILNRADFGAIHDPWGRRYGKTVHTVVMAPWQFSWLNSKPPQSYTDPQYERVVKIAQDFEGEYHDHPNLFIMFAIAEGMLQGNIKRNVSSLYYHTLDVHPPWAKKLVVERTIGAHVFYEELTMKK